MRVRRLGSTCLLIAALLATGGALLVDDDGLLPGLYDGADDQAVAPPSLDPVPLPEPTRLAAEDSPGQAVPAPARPARPRAAPLSRLIPRAPPAA